MFPAFRHLRFYTLIVVSILVVSAFSVGVAFPDAHKAYAIGAWPKAPFGIPVSGYVGYIYNAPLPGGGTHAGLDICAKKNCPLDTASVGPGPAVRAVYNGKLVAIYDSNFNPVTATNPAATMLVMEQDNLSVPGMPSTVYTWYLHMADYYSNTTFINPLLQVGQYYPMGSFLGHEGNRKVQGIGDVVTHLHIQVQKNSTDLFLSNSLDPSPFLGPNVNYLVNKPPHLKFGARIMTNISYVGNMWVTGHDSDYHCTFESNQCNYLEVAVNFVTKASTLPVLALDHSNEVATAISTAFGSSAPTVVTVDPRSTAFQTLPLVDAHGVRLYGAIIVASDVTCGGCDNNNAFGDTPDSNAINARASDIIKFLNGNGGILALAGAANINVFYNFLPRAVTATATTAPYQFTSLGLSLGLIEGSDDNCCITHNSFQMPVSGSRWQIAETDSASPTQAETLIDQSGVAAVFTAHAQSYQPPSAPQN